MIARFFIVALFGLSSFASAACPADTAGLLKDVNAGLSAFASANSEGFKVAIGDVQADMGCMTERITPDVAGRLHVLRGLDAFLQRDEARAVQAFRAAFLASPQSLPGPEIAPNGGPLDAMLSKARLQEGDPAGPLPPVPDSRLVIVVDGSVSDRRSTEHPNFLQVEHPDGKVVWSGYTPQGKAPDWSELPLPPREKRRLSMVTLGLAAGTGAAVLTTGALALSARGSRAKFDDPSSELSELSRLASRTNSMNTAAILSGVAAVGLGVGTAVTFKW